MKNNLANKSFDLEAYKKEMHKKFKKEYVFYFDGSYLPVTQKGIMGTCIVVSENDRRFHTQVEPIQATTNNSILLAKYIAFSRILDHLEYWGFFKCQIEIKSDNKQLVNQMNGIWKINEGNYSQMAIQCKARLKEITENRSIKFKITLIPSLDNIIAKDSLKSKLFHPEEKTKCVTTKGKLEFLLSDEPWNKFYQSLDNWKGEFTESHSDTINRAFYKANTVVDNWTAPEDK
jgi:ribonuclease HI